MPPLAKPGVIFAALRSEVVQSPLALNHMNYIFATVQWLFWCWILGAVLFAGGDLLHSTQDSLKRDDIWLIAGWFLSILVSALFFVTMGLATGPDR